MALVTRTGKGSKLTIAEMDGNFVYLNNNPLLLGKITADLNLQPTIGNPVLVTGCMDSTGTLFEVGERITFYNSENTVYGTATVVSTREYGGGGTAIACQNRGDRQYQLEITDLSFELLDLLPILTVEGGRSGANANVDSINATASGPSQAIELNQYGSKFKINEIILTGINGTPLETTSCFVHTERDSGGDVIASLYGDRGVRPEPGQPLSGVASLIDSDQWIGMQSDNRYDTVIGSDGLYDRTVGNTIYFSANAAAGQDCTVEVYIFGYTLLPARSES
jgi:hypothetical protein